MAMYPNMMSPLPLKVYKSKNFNASHEKGKTNKEKGEQKIEEKNEENKEEIAPAETVEQKEENQNNDEKKQNQ